MASPPIRLVEPGAPTPEDVEAAVDALRRGGIIAMPSDTIYGLSCDIYNETAVLEISTAKGYIGQRPFVVLFDGSPAWLDRLAPSRRPEADAIAKRNWPGPVTLILPAGPDAPPAVVSEQGGIALRNPDQPLAQAILRELGKPIVSTSANMVGQEPLNTAAEIVAVFGAYLQLVLDTAAPVNGLASTIADLTGPSVRILRRGAVPLK
jgi:L-threonylcarbamoyladenylate synthase